jgi:hypothetical protein
VSPIRGLTDRGADFPEIGRIRKGGEVEEGSRKPGPDLDYFRVDFEDEEKHMADRLLEIAGPAPKELPIHLPLNRVEDVWDAWIEGYTAGGLVYRSNGNGPAEVAAGETGVVFWRDPLSGDTLVRNGLALRDLSLPDGTQVKAGKPVHCVAQSGHAVGQYEGADGSRHELLATPRGRLKVMIRGLNRFAYLMLTTGSQHDIANISAQLAGLEIIQHEARLPGLAGIPLILRRRSKEISVPRKIDGKVKRVRMVKSLISIEADPEWAEVKYLAMMEAATPTIVEGHFVELPEQAGPHPDWETGEPTAADGSAEPASEPTAKVGKPQPSGRPLPAGEPTAGQRSFTAAQVEALLKWGITTDKTAAAQILGRSPWANISRSMKRTEVEAWCRAYARAIAGGVPEDAAADAATKEIAELAGGASAD